MVLGVFGVSEEAENKDELGTIVNGSDQPKAVPSYVEDRDRVAAADLHRVCMRENPANIGEMPPVGMAGDREPSLDIRH